MSRPSEAATVVDDEQMTVQCCVPLASLSRPVEVSKLGLQPGTSSAAAFFTWPPLGPLLFDNVTSDARDHCANERTFLCYLRLAVYMAILSVAITLSFHLNHEPTHFERRMAKPLGLVFWLLSVAILLVGVGNYIITINKYGRKKAIVQTGWKTQLLLAILALSIIATCVVLLLVPVLRSGSDDS